MIGGSTPFKTENTWTLKERLPKTIRLNVKSVVLPNTTHKWYGGGLGFVSEFKGEQDGKAELDAATGWIHHMSLHQKISGTSRIVEGLTTPSPDDAAESEVETTIEVEPIKK